LPVPRDSYFHGTTDSNDTFAGSFIAAILEDKSIVVCGLFACVAASLRVESVGATDRTRTRGNVEASFDTICRDARTGSLTLLSVSSS